MRGKGRIDKKRQHDKTTNYVTKQCVYMKAKFKIRMKLGRGGYSPNKVYGTRVPFKWVTFFAKKSLNMGYGFAEKSLNMGCSFVIFTVDTRYFRPFRR